MPDVRALAAAYGVRVELADLGDWGSVHIVAEYDPDGPVIRVNTRCLRLILRQAQDDIVPGHRPSVIRSDNVILSLSKDEPTRSWLDHAIAHELYHHREAIGEIPRIADRTAREEAADAFADALTTTAANALTTAANVFATTAAEVAPAT
jgi:hypothetical protein